MSGRHVRPSKRAAVAVLAVAALLVLPFSVTPSAAAWVDVEHDVGTFGVRNCASPTGFTTAGAGRLLSGSILGTNLDAVAAVQGASATNPGVATAVDSSNPLSVSALGTVNASLGGLLKFDTGADAAVIKQFARATGSGYSAGSAGGVADSGAISLTLPGPSDPVPRFATLDLDDVLASVTGLPNGGIASLADAQLAVGALASVATIDGCGADWDGTLTGHLVRNYLIAGLSAKLTSPTASAIATTTTAGLSNIHTLVAAVAGSSGLVNAVSAATLTALTSTLSGFVKGTPVVSIALDVDLSPVQALLSTPIKDAAGIVSIDPLGGTVTVDLARLLGASYQSSAGLNGLAPNTQLLLNASALSALQTALTSALSAWVVTVSSQVASAIDILMVDITVSVPISVGVAALGLTVPVGNVVVTVPHTSLAGLAAGTAAINTTLELTPPSCSGLTGAVICGVVNPLLATLTTAVSTLVLKGVLGPVLATAIKTALTPIPGLATLVSNLGTVNTALLGFLSTSLAGLFGPTAVLSLIVNAQDTLVAPTAHPYRTGQYSVTALRLVTLGVASGGVAVNLAKSTVGNNGPN